MYRITIRPKVPEGPSLTTGNDELTLPAASSYNTHCCQVYLFNQVQCITVTDIQSLDIMTTYLHYQVYVHIRDVSPTPGGKKKQ